MGSVNCLNSNIRRIIFLDFDGVLHANNTRNFPILKSLNATWIAISSTWRDDYTFGGLRAFFGTVVANFFRVS